MVNTYCGERARKFTISRESVYSQREVAHDNYVNSIELMEDDQDVIIIHNTDSPAVKNSPQPDEVDHERVQFTALSMDYNENSQTISNSISNNRNSASCDSSVKLTDEEEKEEEIKKDQQAAAQRDQVGFNMQNKKKPKKRITA